DYNLWSGRRGLSQKPGTTHSGGSTGRLHPCQSQGRSIDRRGQHHASTPVFRVFVSRSTTEGENTMTEFTAPPGMHPLSPHLVCAGAAEAIAFYKAAFGAT